MNTHRFTPLSHERHCQSTRVCALLLSYLYSGATRCHGLIKGWLAPQYSASDVGLHISFAPEYSRVLRFFTMHCQTMLSRYIWL